MFPRQSALPLKRWLHAGILLFCGVSLVVIWGGRRVPSVEIVVARLALSLSFDSLGAGLALLLCIALATVDLASPTRVLGRGQAVGTLLLVGAGIAGCAAANLITLCLVWGALDLALLGFEATQASEPQETDARRFIWGNVFSTLLLIMAALWVIFEQGRSTLSPFALQGAPLVLISVAAWLRLGLYPAPTSYPSRWESTLVTFGMGATLWARVVSLTSSTSNLRGVPLLLALLLLAVSCLAASARDRASAQHHLMRHGVGMMVLAPLLQREGGFAVIVFSAVYLVLSLTLLQVEHVRIRLSSLRSWNRLPLALGSLTLMGWPLTLGAAVRWLLLDLSQIQGTSVIYYLILLSYVLVSVPVWRLSREIDVLQPQEAKRDQIGAWIGACAVALPSIALLLAGFAPGAIDRVWAQELPLPLPAWGALLDSGSLFSFVLITLLPIGVSYLIERLAVPRVHLRDSLSGMLGNLLSLDWLYLALEEGLLMVQRITREAIALLEGSFALGWTLIWAATIILYLLDR